MSNLNLGWRPPFQSRPDVGKKYVLSTYFLWALRNQQVMDHEVWRPEGNPVYPYGTTTKESWEGPVVVNMVTVDTVQFTLSDDTIVELAISPSGQITEAGCLNGQYPFSGEEVE